MCITLLVRGGGHLWSNAMTLEQLLNLLRADDFHVNKHAEDPYGYKVWLGCRLIICVYKSGKIIVQGKYDPRWGAESLEHLIPLLPPHTNWVLDEAKQEPFAGLIAQRQGVIRGKR